MPAETHTHHAPLDREAVLAVVRDQQGMILEIDPASVLEGDSLTADLHADSIALIELVEALEEEYSERTAGFEIDSEDLDELQTVRDAVDYVLSRLG